MPASAALLILSFANAPVKDDEVDNINVVLVLALRQSGALGRADRLMKMIGGQIAQDPLIWRYLQGVQSTSAVREG
jgi:hypothetical protein